MLARTERLTTEEYKQTFDKGTLSHTAKATLRLLFVSAETPIRGRKAKKPFIWAVNVPKKVAASAVVRNRIRRQSYEAIEAIIGENFPSIEQIPPHDGSKRVIIIWKPVILNASFDEITQALEEILLKAGVIGKRG